MKASTRLDSIVFQLTPTRTRCDLVIHANMKAEKITSGLVNPFLAHSKTVEHQVAKGGYSIVLQPDDRSDAPWFTKGTVERFVRFVSTPEILERLHTLESEISQIEEALAIQNIVKTKVDGCNEKPLGHSEGNQLLPYYNHEKAIVLFKPGGCSPEDDGSMIVEKNSKIQLIEVLERRKTVLLEEQGMGFASAVAAGFDINQMPHLMSFAEIFGATRFMNACMRFMQLWTRKHEAGQRIDIEAAETVQARSDCSCLNEKQCSGALGSIGETADLSAGDNITALDVNQATQETRQEYYGNSTPPNVFPVFQRIPIARGSLPLHSNHQQSPYSAAANPALDKNAKAQRRSHSRGSNVEAGTWELDSSTTTTRSRKKEEEVLSEMESPPLSSGSEAAGDREEDGEDWEAFQNILLKDSDKPADLVFPTDPSLFHDGHDDSLAVSRQANPLEDAGCTDIEGNVAVILSEFPSSVTIAEGLSDRAEVQVKCEAEDLRLIPERTKENEQTSHDPALDYDLQMCIGNGVVQGKTSKDAKSKPISTVSHNNKRVEARKPKPSNSYSLDEARTRAEKLRLFKAEIQKMKRDKVEEEKKRLENLKMERMKRIAARSSGNQENGKGKPLARKQSPGSLTSTSTSSSIQPQFPTRSRSTGWRGLSDESKSNMMNKRSHSIGNRTQAKNMSAILNHDKFKSASLPELKVKASKETGEAGNEARIEMENGDEQTVTEKTIIALECDNCSSTDHKREEVEKTDAAVDFVIVDGDDNARLGKATCQTADVKDSHTASVAGVVSERSKVENKADRLDDKGHKKQPSGGFRRLLKLARKSSHTSGSGDVVTVSDDHGVINASSSSSDAFRHLTSLLPFRNKVKRSRSLR